MEVEFEIWYNRLLSFSKKINGKLSVGKNPSVGYGGDYLTAQISIDKIYIFQHVVKLNTLVHPSILEFEYKFKNQVKFYLAISERDFFDKLFSKEKIKTGNKNFDKKYTIRSSNKEFAEKLFMDDRIQNMFLTNRLMIFNIQTIKNETIIKQKYMEKKLYSIEEMENAFNFFQHIVKIITDFHDYN